MKHLLIIVFLAVLSSAIAETVDEAWAAYKAHPPTTNPDWVEPITDFAVFKRQWDESKAYNAQYANTHDAWIGYKKKWKLSYAGNEEALRFSIFKPRWEEIIAHNERYAKGQIYYPMYTDYNLDETPEEEEERRKRPVH